MPIRAKNASKIRLLAASIGDLHPGAPLPAQLSPRTPANTTGIAGVKIRSQIKPWCLAVPAEQNAPAATNCRRRRVPAISVNG
jgi:hypothetical protein